MSAIEDFPPEKWNQIMNVNLNAAFHTMRLVVPLMKKNQGQWGRIINISSVHGLVASPHKAAYVAAKHGTYVKRLNFFPSSVVPLPVSFSDFPVPFFFPPLLSLFQV